MRRDAPGARVCVMATETLIIHLGDDPLGEFVVADVEWEGTARPTLGMAIAAAGLDPAADVRAVEVYEPLDLPAAA